MITDQTRRQLQKLMSDPRWVAVEEFVREFKLARFAESSPKRQSEFDTVWYLAEQEGAKAAITDLFAVMEEEARKYEGS